MLNMDVPAYQSILIPGPVVLDALPSPRERQIQRNQHSNDAQRWAFGSYKPSSETEEMD
jgi:hypothetical protein